METLWKEFKTKLFEIRDQFVPKKDIEPPAWKRKGDVPIDPMLQNFIRKKQRLHRRWITSRKKGNLSDELRNTYTRVRNQVKNRMPNTKIKFEKDVVERSKRSHKVF